MRTMRPDRMGYADSVDVLYVAFGDHNLDYVGSEMEIGPWMSVQYSWPDNEVMGMEIYGLKEHFGEPPIKITVPAEEPFTLDIPALSEPVSA